LSSAPLTRLLDGHEEAGQCLTARNAELFRETVAL
jgi:hypothetical protein